ncbi:MAG: leucine-rich repeat domain-containing protein, partial [Prevotella sp.]|nr:leucine-rich repeat domain-containing protein [Prevotella sp.]
MKKKVLSILLAFFAIATTARAQVVLNETNFPDANFRAALASILKISEGDEITEAKIAARTSLDVNGEGKTANEKIADLTGIEHFTALKTLDCFDNKMTSLDVSKNTALTDLDCSNNQLTSLDVSKNTALEWLECYDNQLTSLDLSKHTALTVLYCSNNQLTTLDVSGCTALRSFDCYNNQLTSLDVSQKTALTELSCGSNQLTSLDVSNNTALEELHCYSNQIKGEAMDALVASLLTVMHGEFYVIYTKDANEGNVCTKSQVSVANEKGWTVYDFNGRKMDSQVYEGSDPVDSGDDIEEDSDISQIDNTIYIERAEAATGSQLRLSIKMKNTIEVQGYQFDLYLPEGVSFATDEDGFVLAELSSERTTPKKMNSFDTAIQADGVLRVLCGSSKGYTFDGTDGEVAIITLNIDENMEEGEYPLILKTVKLSDRNAVPYSTDYLKSTLAIYSYTLADANGDSSIDVADYIAVANYILGNAPDNFVSKAADINGDNSIDVADYIGVANLILSGAGATQAPSLARLSAKAPRRAPTNISTLDDAIYVSPITAAPGTQQELSIQMKNSSNVVGFEFSLELPDGITVALDGDNMPMAELSTERTTTKRTTSFDSAIQPNGTLKVLCGTTAQNSSTGKLYTFNGNEGEIARITIEVPANYEEGVYEVSILNALFADEDAKKTTLQTPIVSELTIGDNRIVLDENDTAVPSATTGNVNIVVKRTIVANRWNTICLPFNMTEAQVYAAFGNDV